jgi:uncharacterized membrane protein
MKKAIIVTIVAIASVIILTRLGIFNSLLIFLLVGAIPGTHYNVPSTFMLLTIISIIWLLVFRFTAIEAIHSASLRRSAKRHVAERKKRMPKRRFEQV